MAENVAPDDDDIAQMGPRTFGQVRRPATTARIDAPMAIRISAAQTAPTSGAAMRRNRKAAPQTAPRNSNWPKWATETGRLDAATPPSGRTARRWMRAEPRRQSPRRRSTRDDGSGHRPGRTRRAVVLGCGTHASASGAASASAGDVRPSCDDLEHHRGVRIGAIGERDEHRGRSSRDRHEIERPVVLS